MTIEEIKELIQVVHETGIAELEVARGENRVRIRRSNFASSQEIILPATSAGVAPSAAIYASPAPSGVPADLPAAIEDSPTYVKSPIVGTYYESSSPGSAPFVKVGDKVLAGQVLCIIESMKLMNEIESDVSGTVISKLVENGRPVEYGESLFAIRPA
ncbi:MAG: acetyl-CoA carboxylase biotin carboxyl carrier protein [Bryobacteraceae bacterium]|nr:acetyl-CoA carboxylase biotin carboxyl carrier protein [Bryobacteraceae bacterium]